MRKFMNTLLAGALALTMVAGASAQTPPKATVVITSGGVLSVSIADADFGSHPYSFTDQTVKDDIVVTAKDDRGSGAGWIVTLSGTDFARTLPTPHSFAVSNLTLKNGTVTTDAGQSGTPGIAVTPITMGSVGSTILSAPSLQGMGHYTVTFADSELVVPGGTLVGSYKSDLTITISTAP